MNVKILSFVSITSASHHSNDTWLLPVTACEASRSAKYKRNIAHVQITEASSPSTFSHQLTHNQSIGAVVRLQPDDSRPIVVELQCPRNLCNWTVGIQFPCVHQNTDCPTKQTLQRRCCDSEDVSGNLHPEGQGCPPLTPEDYLSYPGGSGYPLWLLPTLLRTSSIVCEMFLCTTLMQLLWKFKTFTEHVIRMFAKNHRTESHPGTSDRCLLTLTSHLMSVLRMCISCLYLTVISQVCVS